MSRKGDRRNQIISTQSSAKGKTRKFVHFRGTRDRKNSLLDKNYAWNEGKWDDHDKSKESYSCWSRLIMIVVVLVTVAEPDLQIRWGGGGSFPKKNSALQTSVWSKDSSGGGGWPLRAPPLDLPLGDDNSNSTGSDIDFNFVPQTKLNLWLSLICKPVLKSLFWVPTCVPRFKYASLSCWKSLFRFANQIGRTFKMHFC